jgi:hypothetical protein
MVDFFSCQRFSFTYGLGRGNKNMAKLEVMSILIGITVDKGITKLQIYGDFRLVIEWPNENCQNHNINLSHLVTQIREQVCRFTFFKCSHIFHELNVLANELSKNTMNGEEGVLELTEIKDEDTSSLP